MPNGKSLDRSRSYHSGDEGLCLCYSISHISTVYRASFSITLSTPDRLLIRLLLDFEFSEGDSASGYDATGSSIPMRTTYTAGGKTNPLSSSRVFSSKTLLVLIQFLLQSFIQLELRIQPSYQTLTPWHHGLRRRSLTAAWFHPRSEPRWGCRGRPATCTARLLHATALSPLTPTLWSTLLLHSRGTRSSCQHLLHRLITDTVATNSSIPPPLQLLLT